MHGHLNVKLNIIIHITDNSKSLIQTGTYLSVPEPSLSSAHTMQNKISYAGNSKWCSSCDKFFKVYFTDLPIHTSWYQGLFHAFSEWSMQISCTGSESAFCPHISPPNTFNSGVMFWLKLPKKISCGMRHCNAVKKLSPKNGCLLTLSLKNRAVHSATENMYFYQTT